VESSNPLFNPKKNLSQGIIFIEDNWDFFLTLFIFFYNAHLKKTLNFIFFQIKEFKKTIFQLQKREKLYFLIFTKNNRVDDFEVQTKIYQLIRLLT